MWIRTQDRKKLVKVISVEINRVLGSKNVKAEISGRYAEDGLFSTARVSLGQYSTMEAAISEIDAIESAIRENPNGTYTMTSL